MHAARTRRTLSVGSLHPARGRRTLSAGSLHGARGRPTCPPGRCTLHEVARHCQPGRCTLHGVARRVRRIAARCMDPTEHLVRVAAPCTDADDHRILHTIFHPDPGENSKCIPASLRRAKEHPKRGKFSRRNPPHNAARQKSRAKPPIHKDICLHHKGHEAHEEDSRQKSPPRDAPIHAFLPS